MTTNTKKYVQKVIDILGGQSKLARLCGVKQQTVFVWRKTGHIPAERILHIEKLVNYEVSRHELRPDIYPRDG